jgi:ATP-dependent Clp protease adapter protein ClpS
MSLRLKEDDFSRVPVFRGADMKEQFKGDSDMENILEDMRKVFEDSAYTFSYSIDDRRRVSVSVHEKGKNVPLCGMVSSDIADVVQWLRRRAR